MDDLIKDCKTLVVETSEKTEVKTTAEKESKSLLDENIDEKATP